MKTTQDSKIVSVCPPGVLVNNASFTMTTIDTAGYDLLRFDFSLGSTDIGLSAVKLQHSESTTEDFTDITGATLNSGKDIFGNTTTLPAATDDGKIYSIIVNTKALKRYVHPVVTVGAGTVGAYGSAQALLMQASNSPDSIAKSGAAAVVVV